MPRLTAPGADAELAATQAELAAHPAALVVLDPPYLAAAGASGSNLDDMGAVQAIQGVCQQAGCALLVVAHWNKTGDGRGADRISGAGPAAWARGDMPTVKQVGDRLAQEGTSSRVQRITTSTRRPLCDADGWST